MTRTMDELCVNTIRTLAMDAVQRANSGHPGKSARKGLAMQSTAMPGGGAAARARTWSAQCPTTITARRTPDGVERVDHPGEDGAAPDGKQ